MSASVVDCTPAPRERMRTILLAPRRLGREEATSNANVIFFTPAGINEPRYGLTRRDKLGGQGVGLASGGDELTKGQSLFGSPIRSEERRVGQGGVSTCRSRGSPIH